MGVTPHGMHDDLLSRMRVWEEAEVHQLRHNAAHCAHHLGHTPDMLLATAPVAHWHVPAVSWAMPPHGTCLLLFWAAC